MRSDEQGVDDLASDEDDGSERKRIDANARDALLAAQPATVAARYLLHNALGSGFETAADRPQALMLILPDVAWVGPVRDAWRLHYRAGVWEQPLGSATPDSAGAHGWFCIRQPERGTSAFSKSLLSVEDVARALAAGGELLVIAHDLEVVPPIARAAMDRIAEVPRMDWSVLKHVAETIHGRMREDVEVSDEAVAAVGPTALRLAVRRGGSAEAYAEFVMRIASAADVAPKREAKIVRRGLDRVPGLGLALDWGRSLAVDLLAYRDLRPENPSRFG